MPKFIKLHIQSNQTDKFDGFWVKGNSINMIGNQGEDYTTVGFDGRNGNLRAKETPEEILKLIEETNNA